VEITEAKIKLMPSRTDRLQAFCTITIDNDFVIRDIKIIEGAKGAFVAMPSRKLTDKCPKCGGKNHLRARHCNDCAGPLDENRATRDRRGRAKLHADIAHPINTACRERIQKKIIEAYEAEVARSKEPGYVAPKFVEDDELGETDETLSAHEDRIEELADEIEKHRTPHEREDRIEELADEMEKQGEPPEVEEKPEKKKDEGGFSSGIF
jgi:stage V sporulation protein G